MNAFQSLLSRLPAGCYLKADTVVDLASLHRLCQCVVRCGACRFVCAAQDVAHLLKCIEAGGDYVRDVSVTGTEIENAHRWRPEQGGIGMPEIQAQRPAPAVLAPKRKVYAPPFNEAECGGVFDGFSVSSDADPGL